MDKEHYFEMVRNIIRLKNECKLSYKDIYAFGHCNATEELIKLLEKDKITVKAILDNNISKQGTFFNNIPIISPNSIKNASAHTMVLIVARAYEAMKSQLRLFGYTGEIRKLVDYNSYAEYSLSETTIEHRMLRINTGISKLNALKQKYSDCFRIFCPFSALGDVFFAMSYLPYFLKSRKIKNYVVSVVGYGCKDVARIFNVQNIEVLSQNDMDEIIQAELFINDDCFFIAHHDRPYVVNLSKALYIKMIPLEIMYKCGVFGLSKDVTPCKPLNIKEYSDFYKLKKGKTLILSPYAKSVSTIPVSYWNDIIKKYASNGFKIYTNAVGDEEALPNTQRIEIPLSEMQSALEYAGYFIGIRSGLCDVIKYARCQKTAVYPDRCYSDTKWKMADIYHIDGWNEIILK